MSDDPVKRIRIGLVTATVWKNETADKPFYSVQVSRAFRDKDGAWQNSDSFNHDDILNAVKVLERAETYIAAQ